jgi:hypothetical protein
MMTLTCHAIGFLILLGENRKGLPEPDNPFSNLV